MPNPILLSDAIDEFLTGRKARGLADNTLRSERSTLKQLLTSTGNIYVRSIEPRHIDALLLSKPEQQASTTNQVLSRLKRFFGWAQRRGYIKSDPMLEFRHLHEPRQERLFVPLDRFEEVLDAAKHPRDRMIVAVGMYLFLRASELAALKIGDVDLDSGTVRVWIQKTKDFDYMPICQELDYEIRRWLIWYAKNVDGGLKDDMYLLPSKTGHRSLPGADGRFGDDSVELPVGIQPYRRTQRPHEAVKRALAAAGFETQGQGCHTFRRSGARALFEEARQEEGADGALQQTKVMLHHKNVSMTEHYLGVSPERARRDSRLKGQQMFRPKQPVLDANVIELRRVSGDQASRRV